MIESPSVCPAGKNERADVLAVQVHGHVVIERNDGQRPLSHRLVIHVHATTIARGAAALQPLAHVVLRDDRSLLLEICISARVISVIMRVDDEPHRLVGDALQRRLNLVGQRCVLIIDNHDAVFADGRADVSSRAFQHVNASGHLRDLDLDLAEILVL